MTTVRRLNDDMYEFIREDKSLKGADAVIRMKGNLAQEALHKLNTVTPLEERQNEVAKSICNDVMNSMYYYTNALMNDPAFNKYIKSLKTSKEIQVNTECKVFNEDLYNKAVDEQRASIERLRAEGDNIFKDVTLSSNERLDKCKAIMLEIQKRKSNIINKSESRFYTDEILTIKVTPQEAYKIVTDFINKRVAAIEEVKKKALDDKIEEDRRLFSKYDEEDFKLAKRLKKVIDSQAFFEMYRYTPFYEERLCLSFDSIEAYVTRDRPEPSYKTPELVIDPKERGIFAYMKQIIRDYREVERLEELKRLNDSMHKE